MPVHRLFAALCCLGMVSIARAQSIPDRVPYTMDSMVNILRPPLPLVRHALVDSLNHQATRKHALKEKADAFQRQVTGGGNQLIPQVPALLKDSLHPQILNRGSIPGKGNIQLPSRGFSDLKDPVRKEFLSYIHASSGPAKYAKLQEGFGALKDSARMERFFDEKLRGFYALFKDHPATDKLKLPGKPENKLQKAGAQTSYGDTTGNASGWWSNVEVQDRFALGSIPVNLQYANVSGYNRFDHDLSGENLGNFKFDREAYLQKVSAHVRKNYDLKKYFLDDIDFKSQLKQFTDARLKSLSEKGDSLQKLIRPEELMYLDSVQLRNQLFANAAGSYSDTALESKLSKLLALQKEIGGSLDPNSMLKNQYQLKSRMERYMQDPLSAAEMAPDLIPMSGLQRLFLKMKELAAGNIAANASKGTVSDLFMTGAAGSMLNKNKMLMLGAGKTRQALPYDIGLDGMQQAPSQSLQFLRMGKGDMDKPHHHVSMINANARNDKRMPNVRTLMQNTFVGALSNRLSLGDWGDVDFEISKSNTSTGAGGPAGDHAAQSKAAIANFFDDFITTVSTGLKYNSALPEYGLTQAVYFNYSGMGYNNPGSPYSRRGSMAYGLQVKRSWLRNKASVQLRTDFRNTSRTALAGSQWKNRTLALDGRLRISRQLTLSGRLHQSNMMSDGSHGRQEQYLNRKVAFSSQWNGKAGGLRFFNQSSLGLQQMHYMTDVAPVKSLFVNAFVSHTIPVGEKMITANVFYNRDIKNAAVYSNLLTADAGYQYRLVKFLQCGSSLTFLDNRGVVRQAGIRQQVSAQLLGRCQVNLSMDARKDLMNTPQNYLYGNFRSELSIFYMLNQ